MTVIMGVNLSDRICLISDTRVSTKDPITGEFSIKHDNMLKIEPLKNAIGVMIASAGDAHLAKYVIDTLNREFSGKTMPALRQGIEKVLRTIGDEYGVINSNAHANFLIAGVDEKANKVINKERFNSILLGKHVREMGNGSIRSHLMNALVDTQDGDEVLVIPTGDTTLFSVSLDLRRGIDIKDSQWGDVLISGPSEIAKEEVGDEGIAKLEFSQPASNDPEGHIIQDGLLTVAMASTLARKHKWHTVGGTYIPMQLYGNGSVVTLPRRFISYDPVTDESEEVAANIVENGNFYRLDKNGAKHRLYLVSELGKGEKGSLQNEELQI